MVGRLFALALMCAVAAPGAGCGGAQSTGASEAEGGDVEKLRRAAKVAIEKGDLPAAEAKLAAAYKRSASIEDLEQIRVRLLGKKGSVTELLKSLGAMDPDARRAAGAKINEAKQALTAALDER